MRRLLSYLATEGFCGQVLLANYSTSKEGAEYSNIVEQISSDLKVGLIEVPAYSRLLAMSLLLDRVSTEYSVCCEDHEFVVPPALRECEAFLDNSPAYHSVRGVVAYARFTCDSGLIEAVEVSESTGLAADDPLLRIEEFLDYLPPQAISLHRTKALQEVHRAVREMGEAGISSLHAVGATSAGLGKCAVIDGLYAVHQIDSRNEVRELTSESLLSPDFVRNCGMMLDHLANISMAWTGNNLSAEEVRKRLGDLILRSLFERCLKSGATDSKVRSNRRREESLPELLAEGHPYHSRFGGIVRCALGEKLAGPKAHPRLLVMWGNPYVFGETVAPVIPELARRFDIVLVLVNYRLSEQVLNEAYELKRSGLVCDVLVAPSHGGTFGAHVYLRNILPLLKHLNFDVFVGISAMQPCECYVLQCALPDRCIRIVLWPHPTNLFLYPELGKAVASCDRNAIDKVVLDLRARIEPSPLREFFRIAPGGMTIWRILAHYALNRMGIGRPWKAISFSIPAVSLSRENDTASRPEWTVPPAQMNRDVAPAPAEPPVAAAGWLRRRYRRLSANSPTLAYWVGRGIGSAKSLGWRFLPGRPPDAEHSGNAKSLSGQLAARASLATFPFPVAERHYPYLLDRIVYPLLLAGRTFRFRQLDWVTQLGTDQFDACLMFSEEDCSLHKILFDNPNFYPVRYASRNVGKSAEKLDAVLFAFTLHSRAELTPELLDLYARDLSIALRESKSAEVHIRPHPGAIENWLEFLVSEMRSRGIPCRLVSAARPISEEASHYRGLISAVSGSLRDARLACPHIFVVGSVALSATQFSDPKRVVGFAQSIGWIEADGTYDPRIFQPVTHNASLLPGAAEVIVSLYEGNWNRVPERLKAPISRPIQNA